MATERSLRLKDRVIIVTGGAAGIGRAACLEFAKEGARIAVVDIQEESGRETVELAIKLVPGAQAHFFRADVSNAKEVKELIAAVVAKFGRIDSAFNNAGIGGITAKHHEYPDSVYEKVMAVNVKGVWLCMKYEIEQMLKQGGGGYTIVNTSSIAGVKGFRGNSAYCAAKHAVVGMTKASALEYARSGIRINAVCPSFIVTSMMREMTMGNPDVENQLANRVPMNRLGQDEDVARAAAWLLSDYCSFETGMAMTVSGGLHAL